ncbi:hypothetical protein [uncultured Fibrobacter sp.]|nr:hypothetical protein [uncultured Fibrobacter sp.]
MISLKKHWILRLRAPPGVYPELVEWAQDDTTLVSSLSSFV